MGMKQTILEKHKSYSTNSRNFQKYIVLVYRDQNFSQDLKKIVLKEDSIWLRNH
jgi:hypothetical protein